MKRGKMFLLRMGVMGFCLGLLSLMAWSPAAQAQSAYGGIMSWKQTGVNSVQVEIIRTVRLGQFPSATVGMVIPSNISNNTIQFATPSAQSTQEVLTVIAVDPVHDKYVARATANFVCPTTDVAYIASVQVSFRPDPGAGGGSSVLKLTTKIALPPVTNPAQPFRSSPTISLPETYFRPPAGTPFSLQVPIFDQKSDTQSFRFATVAESNLGAPVPTGSTLDASTGVFTMPSQAAGAKYASQIIVSDGVGYSCMDFYLDFTAPPTPTAPSFTVFPAGNEIFSYPGIARDFQVVVSDPDGDALSDPQFKNVPVLLSPTAASLPTTGLTILSSTYSGPRNGTLTVNLRWQSAVDDFDQVDRLIFVTRNGWGESAVRTLELKAGLAESVFLSGTIRDFRMSYPDFNRANADAGTRFVETRLDSNFKPVFRPSAGATSTSATGFAWWWTTDVLFDPGHPQNAVNQAMAYNLQLTNAFQADPGIFEYSNSAFYPIDGQLFGNEAQAHNNFFTYEIHDFISRQPGDALTFKSSDDLWVFIDGRLVVDMGGIHGLQTATISLDTLMDVDGNPVPMFPGIGYRMDIFYAHRGQHSPQISIQQLKAISCGAGATVPAAADYSLVGGAERLPDGTLELVEPGDAAGQAMAAWLATPEFAPTLDFTVSFGFEMSSDMRGFAVVFQGADNSVTTVGSADGGLGYEGIPNSIAVEFDAQTDAANNDPPIIAHQGHLSIQTQGSLPNSAHHSHSLAQITMDDYRASGDPTYRQAIADGLPHTAKISFQSRLGDSFITMRVFMDTQLILNQTPFLEVEIPLSTWARITGDPTGNAFKKLRIGFTGSTPASTTASSKLRVSNVQYGAMQIDPLSTRPLGSLPPYLLVNTPTSIPFALHNACVEPLLAPSHAAQFTATMSRIGTGETVLVQIQDMGEGTYLFNFTPTLTGPWSLGLTYDGVTPYFVPYTLAVVTTYGAWALTAFDEGTPNSLRKPDDNPDDDFLFNGLEYITGGNPSSPATSPFAMERVGNQITLTYPRKKSVPPNTDIAEYSLDLVHWASATGIVTREVSSLDSTTDQIKLTLSQDADPTKYLRISYNGPGL